MIIDKVRNKLLSIIRKEVIPPDYEVKRNIIELYRIDLKINILVETGTFLGDTVEYFKNRFSKVYSIELADELAKKAHKRFEHAQNVKIIQGDSGKVLNMLLNDIHEPALFWLDGHYSSEFFVGEEFIKTARSEKDTPIEEELNTILSSPIKHLILIDDARLFIGSGDYPTFKSIRKRISGAKNQYKVFVEQDIIHIIPK